MAGFTFTHPYILFAALLAPALLGVYLIPRRRRRGQLALSAYEWLPPFAKSSGLARRCAMAARIGAFLCLIPVAAGIQPGKKSRAEVEQPEALMVVLDISSSMTAQDFSPGNRLDSAKSLLSAFSSTQSGLETGLILLAASPRLAVPVTGDRNAIPEALRDIQPAGFGEDGTAIGIGIASAINRLRDGPWKKRRILLVTDGVNNRGALAPADAAQLAAGLGIRIDTIGIGTDAVSTFWVPTGAGTPVEVKARIQIDDKALEEVSKITGGSYHRAVSSQELAAALQSLRSEETRNTDSDGVRADFTWIRALALFSILLVCLEFLLTRFVAPELPC